MGAALEGEMSKGLSGSRASRGRNNRALGGMSGRIRETTKNSILKICTH